MFFQFREGALKPAEPADIDSGILTAGCLTVGELAELSGRFGFDESTVDACRNANKFFRSGVEVHSGYTFTELRILNGREENDDYIALYLKRNLILIVDIEDEDGSTREKYLSAVRRYPPDNVCCEKILYAFLDSLLSGDHAVLEAIENDLSEKEDELTEKDPEPDFNVELLRIKKLLSQRHTYYAQLLDITDAVCENDNDIFDEANLIYVDNVSKKISRLREDTNSLKSTVEHLQDAYSSHLDIRMNQTMKTFTVLTSIFFPLTIIVGWYGMNFQSMPEFSWKFGYLYVILLSAAIVLALVLIGRRKKWF